MNDPKWLEWAKQLQAVAQNGLLYAENPFDQQRYEAIREIAVQIFSARSAEDTERIRDLFTWEVGYATPKVDVRGAVFKDNQILLVKEKSDGLWTLPGGWADVAETPSEAIIREIQEESGFQTKAVKLLALYDRSRHAHKPPHPYHVYKIFFLCEIVGGSPTKNIETDAVAFYPENSLPELSIRRITASQIARLFEHYRHPDWPADFD